MERRREPRIQAHETVELTVLGNGGYTILAHAVQLSGRGMRLVLDRPIAVSAAIKVHAGDWLALGEVCYCRKELSHYAVGLRLEQALVGLWELAKRNLEFQAEALEEHEELVGS